MWLRRIRGAIGMGLTWALGWAAVGVLIGLVSKLMPFVPLDWFFEVFDAPLPALAVPGFFGGAFFSIVLGIAGRGRKFSELSLTRFTAWGALGGVLLTLFPLILVDEGPVVAAQGVGKTLLLAMGPLVFLSAASAWSILKLARSSEKPEPVAVASEGVR